MMYLFNDLDHTRSDVSGQAGFNKLSPFIDKLHKPKKYKVKVYQ